jgi:hypothetical protein
LRRSRKKCAQKRKAKFGLMVITESAGRVVTRYRESLCRSWRLALVFFKRTIRNAKMKDKRRRINYESLEYAGFQLLKVILFALFVSVFFSACPMEDDPDSGAGVGLDPRLVGTWRFEFGDSYEQFVIQSDGVLGGTDDTLTYSGNYSGADSEIFSGTIRYAEEFSSSAGIIIIEYLPGHENSWPLWSGGEPEPPGNFYGIYYLNLNSAGTEVFLACTNDQKKDNGPTETETLDEAIAKFTQGNMNQLMDLSVGDPQHKVGG